MPLPALDLLAPVIARDRPGFFWSFHPLAVHNRRRGLGMTPSSHANRAAQRLVDPRPAPVQAPLAARRLGRWPGRILTREIAPGTAGAQHVEERVDEPPPRRAGLGHNGASCAHAAAVRSQG
jgi:hypothetical protein